MSNWTREYGYGDMMVILAKEDETLLEHTENTLKVLKSMKECYPEIPEISGIDNFWDNIFYSLFFHDFGKASNEFQEVLLNKSATGYWDYRHELISASFVDSLDFLSDEDQFVIRLGIITHHKDIITLVDRYKGFFNHGQKMSDKMKKYDLWRSTGYGVNANYQNQNNGQALNSQTQLEPNGENNSQRQHSNLGSFNQNQINDNMGQNSVKSNGLNQNGSEVNEMP
jgi:CRISPR-associated endonuclease Cas3-HD